MNKDKIKWFFVVVDLIKKEVEIFQTKEASAKRVGVHPNTIKLENNTWRRYFIDRKTKEHSHFIVAKRYITPNSNMERDYKKQSNTSI